MFNKKPINFNYRSKFNDKVEFVCCPLGDVGSITKYTNFTVYLYINNVFKKRYENIFAGGFFALNQQIDILFKNF